MEKPTKIKAEMQDSIPANDNMQNKESYQLTVPRRMNILLGAATLQLVLALLMYLIPSTSLIVLLIEGAVAVGLAVVWHNWAKVLRPLRIWLRVLNTFFLSVALLAGLVITITTIVQFQQYTDAESQLVLRGYCWITMAIITLPILLFLQPALAVTVRQRSRYELVLLRITAILTFVFTLLLCLYALSYEINGNRQIVTTAEYSFSLFNQDMHFSLNYDGVLSRILLCLCSGVVTVFSFLIHPEARIKAKKQKSK